jgi:hypothetical protein
MALFRTTPKHPTQRVVYTMSEVTTSQTVDGADGVPVLTQLCQSPDSRVHSHSPIKLTCPCKGDLRYSGLAINDRIDCKDRKGFWYEAVIVRAHENLLRVHFVTWHFSWDEWVPSGCSRIAPLGTHIYGPAGTHKESISTSSLTCEMIESKYCDPHKKDKTSRTTKKRKKVVVDGEDALAFKTADWSALPIVIDYSFEPIKLATLTLHVAVTDEKGTPTGVVKVACIPGALAFNSSVFAVMLEDDTIRDVHMPLPFSYADVAPGMNIHIIDPTHVIIALSCIQGGKPVDVATSLDGLWSIYNMLFYVDSINGSQDVLTDAIAKVCLTAETSMWTHILRAQRFNLYDKVISVCVRQCLPKRRFPGQLAAILTPDKSFADRVTPATYSAMLKEAAEYIQTRMH